MFQTVRNAVARGLARIAIWTGGEGDWGPFDDRWYHNLEPGRTLSGVNVNAETAMRLGIINACIRLLSFSIGMVPWFEYERLSLGRRQKAEGEPIYHLLHDRPNEYQTPFEFKQGVASDLLRFGNSYNEKIPGPSGMASQLWPIHPIEVCPHWFDRKSGRRRVYDVSASHDGRARVLTDEQVWHPRLMSLDRGLTGASPIRLAREGIGLALATQIGVARLMADGMVPGLVFSTEERMTPDEGKKKRASLKEQLAGPDRWGEPILLGKGGKVEKISISPKDAQSVELLTWSGADLARIYGIPLHLLQMESKDTSWGSGIEQLLIAFKTFTAAPIATLLEESADANLIVDGRRFFTEFNLDALLRGDLKSRYEAYQIAVNANNPWLKRNDILRIENMDPDPGPDGERYIRPTNNVGAGKPDTQAVMDRLDELSIAVGVPTNGTRVAEAA